MKLCECCNATGLVTCYHPLLVRCIRRNMDQVTGHLNGREITFRKLLAGHLRQDHVAIPCRCLLGDNHARRMVKTEGEFKPVDIVRFGDHHDMVRVLPMKADYIDRSVMDAEIVEHVLVRPDDNPFNDAL